MQNMKYKWLKMLFWINYGIILVDFLIQIILIDLDDIMGSIIVGKSVFFYLTNFIIINYMNSENEDEIKIYVLSNLILGFISAFMIYWIVQDGIYYIYSIKIILIIINVYYIVISLISLFNVKNLKWFIFY